MAFDYIEETNLSKVINFSDSLSVLQSINNFKKDNSVIQDIILRSHNMSHKQIISFVGYLAKPAINKYLLNKWQLVWDTAVDNKLHSIKSVLGEWRPAFRTDRKEEAVLARLRIGHTFISHIY